MEGDMCERIKSKTGRGRARKRKSVLWLHIPKKRRLQSEENITPKRVSTQKNDSPQNTTPDLQSFETVRPTSPTLCAAPRKNWHVKRTPPKPKKTLFQDSAMEQLTAEIIELTPSILLNVYKNGKLEEFCLFLRLVAKNEFPLTNICFLLLLDVARWYSLKTTSTMKYQNECLKFWKVMYRLFHGKALRFMSGEKSDGPVVNQTSKKGYYDPQKSCINFAVPNVTTLTNFDNCESKLPKEILPGIIEYGINLRPKNKCYVLSVDGKKLAPGLNNHNGDQDLFGHEENETLEMTTMRLNNELKLIDKLQECWQSADTDSKCDTLITVIKTISVRTADMRSLFLKQNLALKKFQKEAGDNWKESRFVYAISSVLAQIYQIRTVVQKLLHVNDKLCEAGDILKSKHVSKLFTADSSVDLSSQGNCIRLKETSNLPGHLQGQTRFVKQRSVEWFESRQKFRLTGSSLYGALGLDTLKKQQKHYDIVIKGENKEEEMTEELRRRLEHGTRSEIHALATLTSKVLPIFYPNLKYVEEGAHVVVHTEGLDILVSPDGSLCYTDVNSQDLPRPLLGCEFKCPLPAEYKTPVQYEIPLRYIPQILAEMASMGVDSLIYFCWSEQSSTVFRASFAGKLWNMILEEASDIYGRPEPKRPTRLSLRSKEIGELLKVYRRENTEFLCEVASVKGKQSLVSQTNDYSPYLFPVVTMNSKTEKINIDMISSTASMVTKEVHQLCRKKATEVLVWLLSDTDRSWHPEVPHSVPVAYAMKGYSLPTKPMREMHDHILQKCNDEGLNVVCSTFDGQWLKLATRDLEDKPLTLLQLQRDVFDEASKTNRNEIVSKLKTVPLFDGSYNLTDSGKIIVSSNSLEKIMETLCRSSKITNPKENVEPDESRAAAFNASCLPNEALESLILDSEETEAILRDVEPNTDAERPVFENETEAVDGAQKFARCKLSDSELALILNDFQNSSQKSTVKRWNQKTIIDVRDCILNVCSLQKLTHNELNALINGTKKYQQTCGLFVRKSWNIEDKANALSRLVGSGIQKLKEKTVKTMKPLKEIAAMCVQKSKKTISKCKLNNVLATVLFDKAYRIWLENSPFNEDLCIENVGTSKLFSYPERNKDRKKLEAKCVDYHHLFVNLRVKVCKDGLQHIQKEAWHAVAESDNSIISKAIVVDLIDKQNNAYAKRTFSLGVESQMRKLEFHKEANFCRLVREWYEAEDSPGLSATERCKRRLKMKNFLLYGVDFGVYPMAGMYIKGFPKVMFEAFLQRIDTTFQLHTIMKTHSYNSRSISSLVNETFFGELSELEPTKLGCPKAVSVPRLISAVTEILHFRCNPSDRHFKMITTRKSVYPRQMLMPSDISPPQYEYTTHENSKIIVRDHAFDTPARRRKKQRKSKREDVSRPQEVARGCLPVRIHHKCDESKLLPTTRLGIELN